jgi:hypothetical protein
MNYQINTQKTPPIKVIFCLPGASFSRRFLCSWTDLVINCLQHNVYPILSSQQDAVVYYVRNKCLGGDVRRGKNQKPYDGKFEYDYLMWIDSDIVFSFNQFYSLLQKNLPTVSGLYAMDGGTHYPVVKNWDEEYFKQHGTFEFSSVESLKDLKNPFEVDYVGFGFILIKKGIFETLEYPWFRPKFFEIGNAYDFCSEDVGICKSLKEKGHKIYVDPTIRVGHEKKIIY